MYTHHEASFNPASDFDLVANGIQNVWICQMGSEATDGSFDQFKDNLLQSNVNHNVFPLGFHLIFLTYVVMLFRLKFHFHTMIVLLNV